jgi:hypothetical protein
VYVLNNPLKYTDPSGEIEEMLQMLAINSQITGMSGDSTPQYQYNEAYQAEVELGQAAMQLGPTWQWAMDHPYVAGPAVGIISGLGAAGAVIATGGTFVCGFLCGPAATVVGGAAGTLGSTGRIAPETLQEQLAMSEVVSNPGIGQPIISSLSDPRWLGWAKMEYIKRLADGTNIVIHYVAQIINNNIVAIDDFKFK